MLALETLDDLRRQKFAVLVQAKLKELLSKRRNAGKSVAQFELQPVYLGAFNGYGNTQDFVTTAQMMKRLQADARTWTKGHYEQFVPAKLRAYFEPLPGGKTTGYGLRLGVEADVDHILPAAWGGLDHPRNYVLMPSSLNRSLKDLVDPKVGFLSNTELRAVQRFAQFMREQTLAAREEAIRRLPQITFA